MTYLLLHIVMLLYTCANVKDCHHDENKRFVSFTSPRSPTNLEIVYFRYDLLRNSPFYFNDIKLT